MENFLNCRINFKDAYSTQRRSADIFMEVPFPNALVVSYGVAGYSTRDYDYIIIQVHYKEISPHHKVYTMHTCNSPYDGEGFIVDSHCCW